MNKARNRPAKACRLGVFLLPATLCAVLLALPSSARAQEDFAGHWEGSFTTQTGAEMEFKVDFERAGNGWGGTIDFPDPELPPHSKLKEVAVDRLHIIFKLVAGDGAVITFDGSLHPKQGTIVGDVFKLDKKWSFSLKLNKPESKRTAKDGDSASPSAQRNVAKTASESPGGGFKQHPEGTSHRGAGEEGSSDSGIPSETGDQKPRFLALIFGTDNYDNWKALANPVLDAKQIGNVLSQVYGYDAHVFENQSYTGIKQKLQEYKDRNYGPMDELLIFFAGHGDWDEYDRRGYLIARDSAPAKAEVRTKQIDFLQLLAWVDQIKCDHILLVLDVCQGGTIISGSATRSGDKDEESAWENVKKRLAGFKTRRCMTSGGKEYVDDGVPGHHSPYARSLLQALGNYSDSKKGENILSLNSIQESIEKSMKGTTPEIGGCGKDEPGSNFYFIVGGGASVPSPK